MLNWTMNMSKSGKIDMFLNVNVPKMNLHWKIKHFQ